MTIGFTSFNKFRFHLVNDVLFLLSHGLSQCVTFSTGKVSQQSGQEHHLFLIDRNAIGILKILLHDGDIILNLFPAILSGNEGRDIIHRSGTIQSIHGNEIFKHSRMQFLQIFLHT